MDNWGTILFQRETKLFPVGLGGFVPNVVFFNRNLYRTCDYPGVWGLDMSAYMYEAKCRNSVYARTGQLIIFWNSLHF